MQTLPSARDAVPPMGCLSHSLTSFRCVRGHLLAETLPAHYIKQPALSPTHTLTHPDPFPPRTSAKYSAPLRDHEARYEPASSQQNTGNFGSWPSQGPCPTPRGRFNARMAGTLPSGPWVVNAEVPGITPVSPRRMVPAGPCSQHSPEQNAAPLPERG